MDEYRELRAQYNLVRETAKSKLNFANSTTQLDFLEVRI